MRLTTAKTATILTAIMLLAAPARIVQAQAPAGGANNDPVQKEIDALKERAKSWQQKADRLRRTAADMEREARDNIQRETQRLNRLRSEQTAAKARRDAAAAEEKAARERKQKAQQEQRDLEQQASQGSEKNAELARQYEREHRDQIARLKKEMDDAWRKYQAAVQAHANFCNNGATAKEIEAAQKHMMRMQTEYNAKRRAHDEFNPPGKDGEFTKAIRQRGALRKGAEQAHHRAIRAEGEENAARTKRTQAADELRTIGDQMRDAEATLARARQSLERAKELRAQADHAAAEAQRLAAKHKRRVEAHAKAKAQSHATKAAQEKADKDRRNIKRKLDLDIGGRGSKNDIRLDDIRRRLWKKLLDSNDVVLSNIGRALGAMQTGDTMRTATGFGRAFSMVYTLAKDKVENWNWGDVITGTRSIDHGEIYGKMTITYNKKTGEYVAVFVITFPPYKNPPLGVEPDKPYTIILHGTATPKQK